MKKVKKNLKILLGCLLIGIALNLFFTKTNLVPSGMFGFAVLYNSRTDMNLSLIIMLSNLFFFILSYLFLTKRELKSLVLPFILIPLTTFLTSKLSLIVDLKEVDKLLISLYGGVLMGMGCRFLYKEKSYASGSDVIMLISKKISKSKRHIANYVLDAIWIIFSILMFGFEESMYSLITIIIIEYLSNRAFLGVSDSKVFYIITKKDDEVKKYILDELNYELTIFDVKGGFLKTKNKVLMSVIPTKDYYKLREGVKMIDPNAFISITDSYEVLNQNKSLKEHH